MVLVVLVLVIFSTHTGPSGNSSVDLNSWYFSVLGLLHSCLKFDGHGLNPDGWEKVNNCTDDLLVVTLAFSRHDHKEERYLFMAASQSKKGMGVEGLSEGLLMTLKFAGVNQLLEWKRSSNILSVAKMRWCL